jgi:hypothetical protein
MRAREIVHPEAAEAWSSGTTSVPRRMWVRGLGRGVQRSCDRVTDRRGRLMNNTIYIVGVVVIVLAILAFFGLR